MTVSTMSGMYDPAQMRPTQCDDVSRTALFLSSASEPAMSVTLFTFYLDYTLHDYIPATDRSSAWYTMRVISFQPRCKNVLEKIKKR